MNAIAMQASKLPTWHRELYRAISTTVCLLVTSSCGQEQPMVDQIEVFNFKSIIYRVPKQHIVHYSTPHDPTWFYLRLKGQDERYELVYSDRNYRDLGPYAVKPSIAYIGDASTHRSFLINNGDIEILCIRSTVKQNCGFRIDLGEVRWAVLFNNSYLASAKDLESAAKRQLSSYREDEDAHR